MDRTLQQGTVVDGSKNNYDVVMTTTTAKTMATVGAECEHINGSPIDNQMSHSVRREKTGGIGKSEQDAEAKCTLVFLLFVYTLNFLCCYSSTVNDEIAYYETIRVGVSVVSSCCVKIKNKSLSTL
jgi:hypothetical protein